MPAECWHVFCVILLADSVSAQVLGLVHSALETRASFPLSLISQHHFLTCGISTCSFFGLSHTDLARLDPSYMSATPAWDKLQITLSAAVIDHRHVHALQQSTSMLYAAWPLPIFSQQLLELRSASPAGSVVKHRKVDAGNSVSDWLLSNVWQTARDIVHAGPALDQWLPRCRGNLVT